MNTRGVCFAEAAEFVSTAHSVAERVGWPLVSQPSDSNSFRLSVGETGITLLIYFENRSKLVFRPTLRSPRFLRRLASERERDSLLARAVLRGLDGVPTVLDPMAGLLHDAVILASFGCEVHARERCPVVALLTEQALNEARGEKQLSSIINRIAFSHGDGRDLLRQSVFSLNKETVLYLDPMFPERQKQSAKSRGEMQALQSLVGEGDSGEEVFEAAMHMNVFRRVVVKRQRKVPFLGGWSPARSYFGRSVRYDVYPGIS